MLYSPVGSVCLPLYIAEPAVAGLDFTRSRGVLGWRLFVVTEDPGHRPMCILATGMSLVRPIHKFANFLKSKIIPYCLLARAWLIFRKPEFYHPCQECGGQKTAVGMSASYGVGIKLSCLSTEPCHLPKLILHFPFAMCFDQRLITRIFSFRIVSKIFLSWI